MTAGKEKEAEQGLRRLISDRDLRKEEFFALMETGSRETEEELFRSARECSTGIFGRQIYLQCLQKQLLLLRYPPGQQGGGAIPPEHRGDPGLL